MIVFPNCKINLGLNVIRKREDGFHDIETVFYPLSYHDILEIILSQNNGQGAKPAFTTSGLEIKGESENNLCFKAYNLLKEKFPDLAPVQMHLHKVIPAGSGLGGGSADGAFALKLLNELASLGLNERDLLQLASRLGSDCPFFIINKPCFSTGRGEVLEKTDLNLSGYKFVVVNPRIHSDTAFMFSKIKPAIPGISLKEKIKLPVEEWKNEIKNDFELIAFDLYPEIKGIKDKLYNAGAIYASMSGSGSTVYGIFKQEDTQQLFFPAHYIVFESLFEKYSRI